MFLGLLLPALGSATATTATTTGVRAPGRFKAVARRQPDLQLDDLIPLLVRSLAFWNRQQLSQAAT
jgi:hypothetical protein